ncbi:hypothetical protein EB24_01801 [Enterococcus hirae]|nr:hypothetical protein EB24_01801 [Enterococcus hirae]RBT60756.1 hypothetical protein EB39_01590 [Enterococcus hirae]
MSEHLKEALEYAVELREGQEVIYEQKDKVFANFWSEFKRYFAIPRYGELPVRNLMKQLILLMNGFQRQQLEWKFIS